MNDPYSNPNSNAGTNETQSNKTVILRERRCLPNLKEPGPFDIICGRGKNVRNHSGNQWLRQLTRNHLSQYTNAPTKAEKSEIISSIIEQVRSASGHGGFIRKDRKTGQWWEVGDHTAREKLGLLLRDAEFGYVKRTALLSKQRKTTKSNPNHTPVEDTTKRRATEPYGTPAADFLLQPLHSLDSRILSNISGPTRPIEMCYPHYDAWRFLDTSALEFSSMLSGSALNSEHSCWPMVENRGSNNVSPYSLVDTLLTMSIAGGGPGLLEQNCTMVSHLSMEPKTNECLYYYCKAPDCQLATTQQGRLDMETWPRQVAQKYHDPELANAPSAQHVAPLQIPPLACPMPLAHIQWDDPSSHLQTPLQTPLHNLEFLPHSAAEDAKHDNICPAPTLKLNSHVIGANSPSIQGTDGRLGTKSTETTTDQCESGDAQESSVVANGSETTRSLPVSTCRPDIDLALAKVMDTVLAPEDHDALREFSKQRLSTLVEHYIKWRQGLDEETNSVQDSSFPNHRAGQSD